MSQGETIRLKLLITLAAIAIAVLIVLATVLGFLVYNELIAYQKNNPLPPPYPFATIPPSKIIPLPVPVIIQQSNSTIQDSSKPNIVVVNATAEDYRTQVPYSLSGTVFLNNTGNGVAYDAYLHVVAYNKEGEVVDRYYSFSGMTGQATLEIDFSYNYLGDPIENCTITPVYTGTP